MIAGGLLPDLSARLPGLDPAISAFYEGTHAHDVPIRPRCSLPVRGLLWLWNGVFARRWRQLCFPVGGAPALSSEIYALDAARVWVRRYLDPAGRPGDRVLYVARFDTVSLPSEPDPCVRIALPVPGGMWIAIFRAEISPGRLRLTEAGGRAGGVGFYLVPDGGQPRYLRAFREELSVEVVRGGLAARHRFSWLGWGFLTLDYAIGGAVSVAR